MLVNMIISTNKKVKKSLLNKICFLGIKENRINILYYDVQEKGVKVWQTSEIKSISNENGFYFVETQNSDYVFKKHKKEFKEFLLDLIFIDKKMSIKAGTELFDSIYESNNYNKFLELLYSSDSESEVLN